MANSVNPDQTIHPLWFPSAFGPVEITICHYQIMLPKQYTKLESQEGGNMPANGMKISDSVCTNMFNYSDPSNGV